MLGIQQNLLKKSELEINMYSLVSQKALIVIPAFNEGSYIEKVIENCKELFPNILIVDDGSEDNTSKILHKIKDIFLIKHCLNCGQGTAISSGLQFFLNNTNLQYLITIDADGQHDPKEAYDLLNHAKMNNYDVVLGSRFLDKSTISIPRKRIFALKIAVLFESLFYGIKLSDAHNGLRVLSRQACESLNYLDASGMAHATEIPSRLCKAGYDLNEFPCKVNYTLDKDSTTLISSLNIISDLIQRK